MLQKNGVLTAEEAWAKKEANEAIRSLIQITRNRIKNDLKAYGVVA